MPARADELQEDTHTMTPRFLTDLTTGARTPKLLLHSAAALLLAFSGPSFAQSSFSPAIKVNDGVVSYYEIDQREMLLKVMNAPGDLGELARQQLIEDRLKLQAAKNIGISPSEEGVQNGLENFAKRVNMKPDEMFKALAAEGIDEETMRDFIISNIAWGGVVQTRFGANAEVSEDQIDLAIASSSGAGGIRVLLTEIIIPVTPQTQAQVQGLTNQLAEIQSFEEFEAAARQYSGSSTRDQGGKIDWINITDLPAELRPTITALRKGDVTPPLPLPNAVALFQLRGVQETGRTTPAYSAIDYALYLLPGGRTPENLETAADIKARVNRCDDLYGIGFGQPIEQLQRESHAPSEIPRDIALELAKMDDNEITSNLTTANGQSLILLMLCGRTAQLNEEVSREDVAQALRNQRLESYAKSYLSQLRAEARIVEK